VFPANGRHATGLDWADSGVSPSVSDNHQSPLYEEAALSRIQQVIDTLEVERAEVQAHLAWLEQQISEFHAHNDGSATAASARSVRRATARRASTRRATARSRQSDTKASIIEFLAKHPGSTAGDIGKALNLNPGSVSTRLTQLAKTGEIQKASRGYSAT
jgi:predicted transcriptional regulator